MLIHHLPRSYLFSLATLRESIRVKRATASMRWANVRRKSRLAIILSRMNLFSGQGVSLAVVNKLQGAGQNFKHWMNTIETAGQLDAAKVVGQRDLSTVKKSVKDRFKAKKAWKRARMKTKAIQHWTKADECLQNALRDVQKKQRNLELLAEVGEDDSY